MYRACFQGQALHADSVVVEQKKEGPDAKGPIGVWLPGFFKDEPARAGERI